MKTALWCVDYDFNGCEHMLCRSWSLHHSHGTPLNLFTLQGCLCGFLARTLDCIFKSQTNSFYSTSTPGVSLRPLTDVYLVCDSACMNFHDNHVVVLLPRVAMATDTRVAIGTDIGDAWCHAEKSTQQNVHHVDRSHSHPGDHCGGRDGTTQNKKEIRSRFHSCYYFWRD